MELNQVAKQVVSFINQTNQSVFLTGNAGTGKTTLVNHIVQHTYKKHAVVAPTGIAALNARGVTIHSLFQLPFACFVPDNYPKKQGNLAIKIETPNTLGRHFRMSAVKKAVIRELELLIIDEVSMLRPDILDAMNAMLQKVRKNKAPFGGVQVLFVGDLMQLPPVINHQEWQVLSHYYQGKFFFHALVLQNQPPAYLELDKIYRQQDNEFINILNQLRHHHLDVNYQNLLNKKVNQNFDVFKNPGYITLTTHNRKADNINKKALEQLDSKSYFFDASVVNDFPEHIYPIESRLELKRGAQVMFIKNDLDYNKRYYNGSMGTVVDINEHDISVQLENGNTIDVERYEWENIKYQINESSKEIEEKVVGTFVQFPLKLAYAITVHKSQGLTFDKAALDVQDVFISGQLYVAFSRLTSLDGLVLLTPFNVQNFDNHSDVLAYADQKLAYNEANHRLTIAKERYTKELIINTYQWKFLDYFWKNHLESYQTDSGRSYKNASYQDIKQLYDQFIELKGFADKFIYQLQGIFSKPIDYELLSQRISKSLEYFLPKFKDNHIKIKQKIIAAQKVKRAKEYVSELFELDDNFIKVIQQLFRTNAFVNCLKNHLDPDKQSLNPHDFVVYHQQVKDIAVETYKKEHLSLVEEPLDVSLEKNAPKKKKAPKKPTIEITLELFRAGKNVADIANERQLATSTIMGHFEKLIKNNQVEVSEILADEQIENLSACFEKFGNEISLTELKELTKDTFSWEELKLYKAYLSKDV